MPLSWRSLGRDQMCLDHEGMRKEPYVLLSLCSTECALILEELRKTPSVP